MDFVLIQVTPRQGRTHWVKAWVPQHMTDAEVSEWARNHREVILTLTSGPNHPTLRIEEQADA